MNNTGNPVGSKAFLDFEDNVQILDQRLTSDQDTFQDRLGKSRLTWAGIVKAGSGDPAIAVDAAARAEAAASQVQQDADQIAQEAAQQAVDGVVVAVDGAVDRAEGAATRAEASAIAAYSSGNQFDNTSQGLAATVGGQYFLIRTSDPQVFNVYLNDYGTAVASGQFRVPGNAADKLAPVLTVVTSGSSSEQVGAIPDYSSYSSGDVFIWVPTNSNTGPMTLNINSLGEMDVVLNRGIALRAGQIRSGCIYLIRISVAVGAPITAQIISTGGNDGLLVGGEISNSLALSNPNLFTANQVAGLDTDGGTGGGIIPDSHNGVLCWSSDGSARLWGLFSRDDIQGNILSAAVRILDWLNQGTHIRFLVIQYSSPSSQTGEVARQEVTIPRAEFNPGFIRIDGMPIHEDCRSIGFFIGTNGPSGGIVKYRDMLLCSGGDATFRVPAPTSATSAVREVWVSPDGSDSGSGSSSLPFATLERAAASLDGRGTIYLAPGNYGNQRLNIYSAKELKIVGGAGSDFKRSVFKYGSQLSITPVPGRAGVYSAALSRTPAWLWVDGIPDEQTLVPYNEQHSLLNGMAHRLASTKVWHIPANNLADALDLIEASATPVCWRDVGTNTIYLSLPDGAPGIDSDVRASFDDTGLLSNSRPVWSPEHHIELVGIDVRYGGVRVKDFRTSKLTDIGVLGAAVNGFDIGNWSELEQCRVGGAGSGDGLGDGFNAHNHAIWTYRDCYGHDNWDDGESSHQNCRVTGWGNIMEYNGGSGFTPALGAQQILHNCLSRKNATSAFRTGNKMGGFQVAGDPTSTDPGIITSLEAYNCVSIGDRNGFHDGTASVAPSQRRLMAVNCRVFDAEETAYACAEIRDCTQSGSAAAKSAGTVVINSSLVTA